MVLNITVLRVQALFISISSNPFFFCWHILILVTSIPHVSVFIFIRSSVYLSASYSTVSSTINYDLISIFQFAFCCLCAKKAPWSTKNFLSLTLFAKLADRLHLWCKQKNGSLVWKFFIIDWKCFLYYHWQGKLPETTDRFFDQTWRTVCIFLGGRTRLVFGRGAHFNIRRCGRPDPLLVFCSPILSLISKRNVG